MKKLLLSLALVAAGAGFAQADTTVEFDFSDNTLTYDGTASNKNVQPLKSVSKDGVVFTFAKNTASTECAWYYILDTDHSNAQIRMYSKSSVKISAPSGQKLNKIVFTLAKKDSSWPVKNYSNVTADNGTITPTLTAAPGNDFTSVTWENTAGVDEVTITVPANKDSWATANPQFRFSKAAVTITGQGGGPTAPAAPKINGAATFYGASTAITMTAATGADIYYTMSTTGEPAVPTTSSAKYDGEIVINATTSFKAIAVKDGLSSSVATATFTKGQAMNVASIADFLEQNTGEVCTFTNPVTVVGLYNKKYLFVQDATGALQIFDAAGSLDRPYKMGQTIKGFTVKNDVYNTTPQGAAKDFVATFPATADGVEQWVKPKQISATEADIKANLNAYVVLTDKITKTGNNYFMQDVQLFNRFSISNILTDALVDARKDATGFAVMFNTTPELFVTQVGEPGTLEVNGIDAEAAGIYGANGYVVAPEGAQVYNMAGMRVANQNLAAGIYLVRHNAKTVKVVVK